MAGRRVAVLDVQELVRRLWTDQSAREIAREMGLSRNTVADYERIAKEQGWLVGDSPDPSTIAQVMKRRAQEVARQSSSVEAYRELVLGWLSQKVEGTAIHALLKERGFQGSYSAVRRFIRRAAKHEPQICIRVEVPPGQEAQVDFGYAGKIFDPEQGRLRSAWAFVMVLSHSRHQYVELVWRQDVGTWLRLHRNAFEFFGGVPRSVVLDNLKAGIVQACQNDPEIQRSYRELASAYGFIIHPCRPRTPRHKGKVEKGGVHYVKRNCLAGRAFASLREANDHAQDWCLNTAGLRVHGTIRRQPIRVFEEVEKPVLQPLPAARYDIQIWKQATLHRDGYVVFENAFYSAPHRLVEKKLWVCGTSECVKIYDEWELVANHKTAESPGVRRTIKDHLPAEYLAYLENTPERCRERALEVGSHAAELVSLLLAERPSDRLPAVQSILKLREKYSASRLDAACQRALAFGELRVSCIRSILEKGLDRQAMPGQGCQPSADVAQRPRFARDWTDFFPGPGESEEKCLPTLN